MTTDFDDLRNHAQDLVSLHGARDAEYEELRQMVHMEWQDPPAGDWIKATMSPGAYNAVMGAFRLLVATEPQLSVPFDEAAPGARQSSEKVEQAAKAMWAGAGRVALRPVHYEAVLSAVLFGEVAGGVTKTADLLARAREARNRGQIARMEQVVVETPYLFEIYNPATCYPDFDSFGLRGMLRRQETTWGAVSDTWGELAEPFGLGGTRKRTEAMVLNDWYDWSERAVWLDNAHDPILHEEHGLGILPVVAQIADGTRLFSEPERQRFPLLYAVWKSGLWKRENLMLTVVYSLIHAIGSNPLLMRETDEPGSPLQINRTVPGGVVDVEPGRLLKPLMEKVVDPSQWQGLDLAQRLNEESTIYKATLGQTPPNTLAFSAISLLSQSGRLPLIGPKELGGAAIANLLTAALTWFRQDGAKTKLYRDGKFVELAPADVPERLVLRCTLEPDIPTDKLQLANIAQALKSTTPPLASDRWIREHILNIGQSEAMAKEIWMEQRLQQMTRLLAAAQVPGPQSQVPSSDAAGGQAMMGEGGTMGQEMQGTMGGQPATPYPPGGVQEGQPLAGPLPPSAAPRGRMGGWRA